MFSANFQPVSGRAGEEHLHRRPDALAGADRADDGQRLVAVAVELGVEEEERQAAEMVAVEVRQHHRVDAVGVDPEPLQRDERGGAEIEHDRRRRGLNEETRVCPSARSERVPAADDRQAHGVTPARLGGRRAPHASAERSQVRPG